MCEDQTTSRLDALLNIHAPSIETALDRFSLPLHLLFLDEMQENARAFQEVASSLYPNTIVAFAVKSNPCRGAIRAASRLGLGVDAASEHELRAAIEEGIDPHRITCNGNAKSDVYLARAIDADALIAVDNETELDRLETIASEQGRSPTILVRFRGMPLSGLTSDDQTTASDWTKFGFHVDEAEAVFARLRAAETLQFAGVSAHIGTQIADPSGYERLLSCFFQLIEVAVSVGLPIRMIDVGGGFPVRFLGEAMWNRFTGRLLDRLHGATDVAGAVTWNDRPMGYEHLSSAASVDPRWRGKSYWTEHPQSRMFEHLLRHQFEDDRTTVQRLSDLGSPTLIVEPGRSLMATAGVTLCEVMSVKTVLGHPVVSLDLGINNHGTNLISPDIFPAAVLPLREDDRPGEAFLAGRLCFSGDMISKAKVSLNRIPSRGERLALYHTGAYGADHFASHSCGFPRPAKVAIRSDSTVEVWRRAEAFEDVFGAAGERLGLR